MRDHTCSCIYLVCCQLCSAWFQTLLGSAAATAIGFRMPFNIFVLLTRARDQRKQSHSSGWENGKRIPTALSRKQLRQIFCGGGVEDHFAIGVKLEDRGGHVRGDRAIEGSGDDSGLVGTVGH